MEARVEGALRALEARGLIRLDGGAVYLTEKALDRLEEAVRVLAHAASCADAAGWILEPVSLVRRMARVAYALEAGEEEDAVEMLAFETVVEAFYSGHEEELRGLAADLGRILGCTGGGQSGGMGGEEAR